MTLNKYGFAVVTMPALNQESLIREKGFRWYTHLNSSLFLIPPTLNLCFIK